MTEIWPVVAAAENRAAALYLVQLLKAGRGSYGLYRSRYATDYGVELISR